MLTAGQVGHLTDSTATATTSDNASGSTSWIEGRLVFNHVPVRIALAAMSRWYGYDFRLADSALNARHITAVFKISDPGEAMTALKEILGVTLAFDSTRVTLTPRRTTGAPSLEQRTTFSQSTEMGR